MEEQQRINDRTFSFALRVIKVCQVLAQDKVGKVLFNQLLRSGTSVGANVEEAQGAQSKKDFLAKMSIARKEAHETVYWLRLIQEAELLSKNRMAEIIDEADQIRKVINSIIISGRKINN